MTTMVTVPGVNLGFLEPVPFGDKVPMAQSEVGDKVGEPEPERLRSHTGARQHLVLDESHERSMHPLTPGGRPEGVGSVGKGHPHVFGSFLAEMPGAGPELNRSGPDAKQSVADTFVATALP
jgi:hypothetical protein